MPRTFALVLMLATMATNAAAACLPPDPAIVDLSGVLERVTFAGPPNYESIKMGDKAETYFVLRLPKPVCVSVPGQAPVSTSRLQLFLALPQYDQFRPKLGHKITVAGRLWPAETGHHHTPLMLTPVKWSNGR